MPLPNRVDPFGGLLATSDRGLFLGNRGGKFHQPDRTLGRRRWASRQWICCVLSFKGRRRHPVWAEGYTELFFLDEPTALAAGHRPCFECRRADATAFAQAWRRPRGAPPPRAAEMDRILHAERLVGGEKRLHRLPVEQLPDATFVTLPGRPETAWALCGPLMLQWSTSGYVRRKRRPRGVELDVLTPPSVLEVLTAGYRPRWHPSAVRTAD